jgi:glycosyltransferase involved in cell wall biosynthesis
MISPLASVVLCTHNRATVLGEALDSLVKQDFSRSAYEIIVVDNASTDETPEVVGRFSSVRCLCEPCLGLSPARNRGVQAAQGEIVAFIDDDAIADPDWVKNLCSVYKRFPEAAGVGGKILPLWPPEGAPSWYGSEFAATFSALDYGDQVQLLRYPRILYGTNMSFRRDVLQAVGGFRVELGRKGKGMMANEEVELMWRIERAGGRCYYTPDAVVFHRVPPERLRMGYLLRRAWGYGVSTVVTEQFIAPVSRTALLCRGLRTLMWEAPITLLRWLSGWLPWRGGQSYRIRHLLILLDDLGRAGQALQLTCKPGKIRE